MKIGIKIALVLFFAMLLVIVRTFEMQLFYDPLLHFFKAEHTIYALPEMKLPKLYFHLFFRFSLNTIASLAILWILFSNKKLLKFSVLLYLFFFVICLLFFTFFLIVYAEGPHQPLFYARRFIIQPLLLFLLVPAFYFFGNTIETKN